MLYKVTLVRIEGIEDNAVVRTLITDIKDYKEKGWIVMSVEVLPDDAR